VKCKSVKSITIWWRYEEFGA